ncbi:hypothetical protein GY45DRAFT_251187 [Cubamyces sp. BRFM 1775]|nr:hypothetical protein GY45DRAFT_251187 [Cubamyces sp. BRFM 1775]
MLRRDVLRDSNAPPMPSLITPAMGALVNAALAKGATQTTSNEPLAGPSNSSAPTVPETAGKKVSRMRVSKTSKTARNLYAYCYIKTHPLATTDEFDKAFKSLTVEDNKALRF